MNCFNIKICSNTFFLILCHISEYIFNGDGGDDDDDEE